MTDQLTPTGRPPGGGPGVPGRPPGTTPPWYVAAVAAILLVIVALLVVLVVRGGDDDTDVQTVLPSTTSTTAASATTAGTDTSATTASTVPSTSESTTTEPSTTTSTTASTTTSTTIPSALLQAVWPAVDSSTRYDDPVEAASDFADDYVGFDDPIVGPFLEGDGRSGEVEIQPGNDGPTTVVFVRQLTADDTWWVIGAATGNIEVASPDAMEEIASPLQVGGRALAFEGVVDVELRADGSSTPLVTGSVTGGGTELQPFEGSFPFDWPDVPGGAVVLRTMSAEDGRVWEAAVVRVLFPLAG